ncbi:hypothetical protein BH09PSE6_BH09PSE6_09160 [soil metagenome]
MNTPVGPRSDGHVTHFIRNIIESDLEQNTFGQRHWSGTPGDGTQQAAGPLDSQRIRTRFPPEPNGYLHVGHAKSICLNFGMARDYRGQCHMRFDDTNPVKEDQEYVDSILECIHWLGFDYRESGPAGDHENLFYASDYFEHLYRYCEYLIETGHAYVDQQSADEMRATRGTLTEPGSDSPWRDRPAAESLQLLREMRAGKHPEGSMIVRARIDMASPNMNLRDPALYRVRFADHHRTGDAWCIYPMYDYAHSLSDALEDITHSVCTLEFQDHRPLYDWALERVVPVLRTPQWQAALALLGTIAAEPQPQRQAFIASLASLRHKLFVSAPERALLALIDAFDAAGGPSPAQIDAAFALLLGDDAHQFAPLLAHALAERRRDPFQLPHQYEFARLNLTYVITSKRRLRQLVDEHRVDGWDDPRMPTIVGLRRRGYTPESIQLFCERIGVSRSDGWIDYALLEAALRDDLDPRAPRSVAVLDPVKLVITNWPEGLVETCSAPVNPHDAAGPRREFPISLEVWIERDDYLDTPTKGFFRLTPGGLVRLKYGYVIKCTGAVRDAQGALTEVHAEYLPDTRSGTPGADSVKVKGNITWVATGSAVHAEVRLYDRLFDAPHPDAAGKDFLAALNPDSRRIVQAVVEPGIDASAGLRYQFERHGYFIADAVDSTRDKPVFNRIATLRDTWGK